MQLRLRGCCRVAALVAAFSFMCCGAADAYALFQFIEVHVTFPPGSDKIVLAETRAYATCYALCSGFPDHTGADADYYFCDSMGGSGGCTAEADAGTACGCATLLATDSRGRGPSGEAAAQALVISGNAELQVLTSGDSFGGESSYGSATAGFRAVVELDEPATITFQVQSLITGAAVGATGITGVFRVDSEVHVKSAMFSGSSVADSGFEIEPTEVGYEGNISIPISVGAGSHTIESLIIPIFGIEFDLDDDQRFTCRDVEEFEASLGGAFDPVFDFDDDQDNDQDDVDYLQLLLGAGAGAGLAGDADGDCARTCADVELMEDAVAANAVFGDEEYSFAMDFDLDGDIDNDDLSALLATLDESGIDGDINADCCVNTADLGLLYAKFSQSCSGCPEDVNGDGVVNTSDLGILVGNMGAGCD